MRWMLRADACAAGAVDRQVLIPLGRNHVQRTCRLGAVHSVAVQRTTTTQFSAWQVEGEKLSLGYRNSRLRISSKQPRSRKILLRIELGGDDSRLEPFPGD